MIQGTEARRGIHPIRANLKFKKSNHVAIRRQFVT